MLVENENDAKNIQNDEIILLFELNINHSLFYFTNHYNDIKNSEKIYKSAVMDMKYSSINILHKSENNYFTVITSEDIIENFSLINSGKIAIFSSLGDSKRNIFNGIITKIDIINKNSAIFYFSSYAHLFDQEVGMLFSPVCRAEFGDKKCKKDISQYIKSAKILELIDNNIIKIDISSSQQSFENGTFIYGNFKSRIYRHSEDLITIFSPFLFNVEVNTDISLVLACDKTLYNCKKYDNVINFRGEPFIVNEV